MPLDEDEHDDWKIVSQSPAEEADQTFEISRCEKQILTQVQTGKFPASLQKILQGMHGLTQADSSASAIS